MWKNIIYIALLGSLVNLYAKAEVNLTHGIHGISAPAKQVSISSSAFTGEQNGIPDNFEVRQNFPNPFNNTTTIVYDLPEATGVYAVVYDAFGRHIKTLLDGLQEPGRYQLEWDGTEDNYQKVASGVYFYVLAANDNYSIGKMRFSK